MKNQITFSQYRSIDLTILTILTVVAEAIVALAASKWFPAENYSLSPMVALVCIIMMRWSVWAAIPAVASGFAFCLAMGATAEQFAVYCIGNCFSLIALIWFKAMGKEAVRTRIEVAVLYVITAFAGMLLGRWLVNLLISAEPDSIASFFLADCLSLLFAVVVVLISRKMDGLFEDQKSYLLRTEEERMSQRNDDGDYQD